MTSDTDINRTELRRTVRKIIRESDTAPTRTALVESVVDAVGTNSETVDGELDALEREGFVYLVGDGADTEVRMP